MSIVREEQEALLSDAARQERQTVGGATVTSSLTGTTVRVDRQTVRTPNGRVVDVEIALVDRVNHQQLGRPVDKQYLTARNSVVARLNLTKWAAATVISCLPIELRSDSCIDPLRNAHVPAVRDGEEFAFLTFQNPHLEPARVGPDAPLACFDYQPIMLAKEFEAVYEPNGGVFAFIGHPEDVKDPKWEHREKWEALKKRAVTYMESMHREARQYWDQKTFYAVREPHKASIRRLFHLGFLKELPNELDKQRDTAIEYPTCPKCQMRQDSPHAVTCQRCVPPYVIDPARAYKLNIISESDEALERLTRAEVKELGISAYVAETSDEKPVRLSMGLMKPKSEAAMRFIEQQAAIEDEEEERKTRKQRNSENQQK
jgi:hypothetical protein